MADSTRQSLSERISAAVTPNLFKTDATVVQEETRGKLDQAQAKLEPDSEKSYVQHAAEALRGLMSSGLHLPHRFTTDTPLAGEVITPNDDNDATIPMARTTDSAVAAETASPPGDSKLWDAVTGDRPSMDFNTSIAPGDALPTSVTAAQGQMDQGLLERAAHLFGLGSGGADQGTRVSRK